MSEAAVTARASVENPLSDDAASKRVWLKSVDVGSWGKAAVSLSEAASEAAEMAELSAMCGAGDGVSCRIRAEQEDTPAFRDMMAQLNVADWGAAAAVLSAAASDAAAVSASALEAIESFGFNLKHLSSRAADGSPDGSPDGTEE
uniref:Uncharacterized protein n=1 Tax=Haptolina ericina TaxID=156174 RepID=A0A7S3EVN4_9EUKA